MRELHECDLWLTLRSEAWPMTCMLRRHMGDLCRIVEREAS